MSAQHLDPLDLYDIRAELSEDEVMVKDTVGRFVDADPGIHLEEDDRREPLAEGGWDHFKRCP